MNLDRRVDEKLLKRHSSVMSFSSMTDEASPRRRSTIIDVDELPRSSQILDKQELQAEIAKKVAEMAATTESSRTISLPTALKKEITIYFSSFKEPNSQSYFTKKHFYPIILSVVAGAALIFVNTGRGEKRSSPSGIRIYMR